MDREIKKTKFNPSYVGGRSDIEGLIPKNCRSVLDVGCSIGRLGAAIKNGTEIQVVGIEFSEAMANEAISKLDKVFIGDAEEIICNGTLGGYSFDTIIFADLLEHLENPWQTLICVKKYLNPNGIILASIPNIRHIDTIYNLVIKGYWPYRERGIHDKTHLRFFTKRNIFELFENAGFSIKISKTHFRILERPHKINNYAKYLAVPGIRNFLAFQYVLKAHIPKNI